MRKPAAPQHPTGEWPDAATVQHIVHELQWLRARGVRVALKHGRAISLVAFHDIERLEARGNYVIVHAATASYRVRETLNAILDRLDRRFFRIHKSAAVNVHGIHSLELSHPGLAVRMDSGATLTVSRNHRKKFLAYVDQHLTPVTDRPITRALAG